MDKLKVCYLNKNTELSKLLRPVIEKYCEIVAENLIIDCDLIIIATYSKILTSEQLDKASIGTINCHQGKVPEYRGSSVINWQIINGEPKIYVSILKTTEGIDDGLILAEEWVDGKSPRTITEIRKDTNQLYIKMMENVLKKITEKKSLDFGKKQIGKIKYWKHRKPEDSEIKDNMSKKEMNNLIRACEKNYMPYKKGKAVEKSPKDKLKEIEERRNSICNFWRVRGYEIIKHTLGMNISLHKKPVYEKMGLGLNLQYLEQFKEEIEKSKEEEIFNFKSKFLKIQKKPNCEEYVILNKKGQFLGDIVKKRGKWSWFSPDMIHPGDVWFREDCLLAISNFVRKLNIN